MSTRTVHRPNRALPGQGRLLQVSFSKEETHHERQQSSAITCRDPVNKGNPNFDAYYGLIDCRDLELDMETMSALIFTSYMVAVGFMDNILRPLLVARGLTTPKPVIMLGVIGGTIAYGIVGLFFGPHVLSVVWVLIGAWAQRGGAATEQSRPEQWAAAHMVVRALTDSGCPLGTESTRTARLRMQI